MDNKFYSKAWFMWLTLIFFAPVGIFLMWKNQRFSSKTRKILSGVFGVWFILVFAIGGTSKDSTKRNSTTTAATKKETKIEDKKEDVKKEEVKKEETKKKEVKFDFATAELTKENVTTAIESLVGKDKLTKVDITVENGKNIVDVTYNSGSVWSEKSLVQGNANTATKVYETLFKNSKVDKVWVWTETEMTDAKGNPSVEGVVNVSMTKENAKDINWSNFKDMVALDYNKLYKIADSHFIHPGIAKNLK